MRDFKFARLSFVLWSDREIPRPALSEWLPLAGFFGLLVLAASAASFFLSLSSSMLLACLFYTFHWPSLSHLSLSCWLILSFFANLLAALLAYLLLRLSSGFASVLCFTIGVEFSSARCFFSLLIFFAAFPMVFFACSCRQLILFAYL